MPRFFLLSLFFAAASVALVGCDSGDDDPGAGRFAVTIENVGPSFPILKSGVFNTPVAADAPAPIGAGAAYEIAFTAGPGQRLSFATMFIQSNDLFYAFSGSGLDLLSPDGSALSGDVTDRVRLYDAGTEVDEEPGVGLNQAPRQSGPDAGAEEGGVLTRVEGSDDGFSYPDADAIIRVTVIPVN